MRTVFKNGFLLDGTEHMQPIPNIDIAVTDDKITHIGTVLPEQNDRVIDLNGRYLMPGLINLHVHLPAGGKPKKKPMDAKKLSAFALKNRLTQAFVLKLCEGYARTELMSGVTTIRTVGGLANLDSILRDKILQGKAIGPRILASNFAVGVPGGHMDGSVAHAVTTEKEAVELVRTLAAGGADLIKLMITGGVLDAEVKGSPGVLKMPPEIVKACCDEAHRLGLSVAAHAEGPEGVRVAVMNGVDTIEHGSVLDREEVEVLRRHNAAVICTISPAVPMAKFDMELLGIDETVQYNSNVVYENMISGVKTALENGIPVGLGTDTGCPYTTHYNMWRELHFFRKAAGVSAEFALHTATLKNARIAGIDHITGSIEVGKCADILITEQNPLSDFRALSKPYIVVGNGTIIQKPKIKKYAGCDLELDRIM